jgi:O-antigen ligase
VGVLSVKKPSLAAALVLAAAFLFVIAVRIEVLPLVLVSTIFVETVSLGGLTIGRLAGAVAVAALAYYFLAHGRASLRVSPLLVVPGLYGLWILASAYWATYPSDVYTTFIGFLLVVGYMLTVGLLVRTPKDATVVLKVLVGGATIAGLVAIESYFTSGGATRATGLLGGGNFDTFGVYQAMIGPMALGVFALARRSETRFVALACLGVITFSIVSSQTRTAMIASVGVALLALLMPWRVLFRSAAQKATYAVAVGVMAGAVLTVAASAAFFARVSSIFNGFSSTGDRGAGRTDLWAAAWNAYSHHPLFGIGAGNFPSEALNLLQTTPGVDTTARYVQQGRLVHNSYLEALTELGPIGLALLVLVIVVTAWYLVQVFLRARAAGDDTLRIVAATLLLALGSLAISMIFLSIALNKPLWILVGLAIALDRMCPAPAPAPAARAAAGRAQ